jgi:hypothetical protein
MQQGPGTGLADRKRVMDEATTGIRSASAASTGAAGSQQVRERRCCEAVDGLLSKSPYDWTRMNANDPMDSNRVEDPAPRAPRVIVEIDGSERDAAPLVGCRRCGHTEPSDGAPRAGQPAGTCPRCASPLRGLGPLGTRLLSGGILRSDGSLPRDGAPG